jgi:conjugative transfer signal peptidase TraF
MTARIALAAFTVAAALLQLIGGTAPKLLVWNASASVPRGLYVLDAARPLHVGELVSVTPPPFLAAFMASRDYVPRGVPLLKRIAALGGQMVCREGVAITIDGRSRAIARTRDSRGRPLPVWHGCHRLRAGDVFLLNAVPDSFDGRYFGVLSGRTITGRATPLWTETER